MTTAIQTPAGAALDELMARVRFEPFHGFMWLVCPSCGSDDLITQPRICGHTHRDFTKCGNCRGILGWDFDIDAAIRKQMIAIGAPIQERSAQAARLAAAEAA